VSLEVSSIPLAWLAGMLSILSPCVWPLVPAVMASATTGGRAGPWFLALGLSLSFAMAGTVLTLALLTLDLDPELFRYTAAVLLLAVAVILLVPAVSDWVSMRLSMLSSRVDVTTAGEPGAAMGQFGVGALLGLVWLPCVGPTLGAAIALASLGQNMGTAFLVMLTFGLGTASVLLFAALASTRLLGRIRPGALKTATTGKKLLGWTLLALALLVISGLDKVLEAWALTILPDWAVSL